MGFPLVSSAAESDRGSNRAELAIEQRFRRVGELSLLSPRWGTATHSHQTRHPAFVPWWCRSSAGLGGRESPRGQRLARAPRLAVA